MAEHSPTGAATWPPPVTPVEFLNARLDEIERRARAAGLFDSDSWRVDEEPWETNGVGIVDAKQASVAVTVGDRQAAHIAYWDPHRVLAWCEAVRAIVERYERTLDSRRRHPDDLAAAGAVLALHGVVKLLTALFADHPDYQESWRP